MGYILLAFLSDLITKILALHFLRNEPLVLCRFFNLVLVQNYGVSFSLFTGEGAFHAWILSGFTAFILGFVLWCYFKEKTRLGKIAFALVFGGGLGNLLDRIRLGSVVDFIDFHIGTWHWPTFNIADSFICLGAFLLILQTIISTTETHHKEEEKK